MEKQFKLVFVVNKVQQVTAEEAIESTEVENPKYQYSINQQKK
jgi:hypothetical protein